MTGWQRVGLAAMLWPQLGYVAGEIGGIRGVVLLIVGAFGSVIMTRDTRVLDK